MAAGEYGHRESPIGNTYFYRLRATTGRWRWWVSVIDRSAPRDPKSLAANWPRLDMAFGEFGGWHVFGLKRAHRSAQRFIERQMRRDQRQVSLSGGHSEGGDSLMAGETRHGPWRQVDGRTWRLLVPNGERVLTYEVERRRAEPGAPAGYYLHGPNADGRFLLSGTAVLARFEATAIIGARCPAPSLDGVWAGHTGGHSEGGDA